MEATAKVTLSDQDIIDLFKDAVREVDGKKELTDLGPSTELAELGLDSVMTMEVIGVLEERLDIRFPDEDLATLRTMNELTTLIRKVS